MNSNITMMDTLDSYRKYLVREEKSPATIEKYVRDIKKFVLFVRNNQITKEIVMEYKELLIENGLAVRSINSMLASVHSFLRYLGLDSCKVRSLRIQSEVFCDENREITKNDYLKLLRATEDNLRLRTIIQTICGTGIRVSELSYFTVESVNTGHIVVSCKNKIRNILIPKKLRKVLLQYAKKNNIHEGIIFRTRNGKPVNRSNIWRSMKKLCNRTNVKMSKVFPHNLRKLFAKTFYKTEKDIAKLADVLGHSSINTTRIYIMTSGSEHQKMIEKLGLIFDWNECHNSLQIQ